MPFLQWISGEADSSVLQNPVFGSYGLVEYYPGNVNLVISVPHGGGMRPPFIPDRVKKADNAENKSVVEGDDDTSNRITFAADIWTQDIAKVNQ